MNALKYFAVAAAVAGLFSCSRGNTPKVGSPMVKVCDVVAANSRTVFEFPGRVVPSTEVNLAFKVSGSLERMLVKEGDYVREGQVIVQMDPRDYKLQFEATEAEYRNIKAEAERVIGLYKDSVVTEEAYDKARYGLKQITAKYENARNQLEDTRLKAPFSGRIQKIFFDPPTVIGAGMPVAAIISQEVPEIEINIPAKDYMNSKDIVAYSASFEFLSRKEIPLRLIGISPKANANQLYTVRLALPGGLDPQPAPGMNATVYTHFQSPDSLLYRIPTKAMFQEDGSSSVWIYNDNGTIHRLPVEVKELHTDGTAVVEGGFEPGARIVCAGVHKLTEGQTVRRMEEKSKTNVGGIL